MSIGQQNSSFGGEALKEALGEAIWLRPQHVIGTAGVAEQCSMACAPFADVQDHGGTGPEGLLIGANRGQPGHPEVLLDVQQLLEARMPGSAASMNDLRRVLLPPSAAAVASSDWSSAPAAAALQQRRDRIESKSEPLATAAAAAAAAATGPISCCCPPSRRHQQQGGDPYLDFELSREGDMFYGPGGAQWGGVLGEEELREPDFGDVPPHPLPSSIPGVQIHSLGMKQQQQQQNQQNQQNQHQSQHQQQQLQRSQNHNQSLQQQQQQQQQRRKLDTLFLSEGVGLIDGWAAWMPTDEDVQSAAAAPPPPSHSVTSRPQQQELFRGIMDVGIGHSSGGLPSMLQQQQQQPQHHHHHHHPPPSTPAVTPAGIGVDPPKPAASSSPEKHSDKPRTDDRNVDKRSETDSRRGARRRVHPVSKFIGEEVCWTPDDNDENDGARERTRRGGRGGRSSNRVGRGRGRTPASSRRNDAASAANVRSDVINKRRKQHKPWSIEETKALVRGVEICGGGKWADIKRLGFREISSRSPVDLKDKWRNLLRVALLPAEQIRLKKADNRHNLPIELLQRVKELAQEREKQQKIVHSISSQRSREH